MAVQDGHGKIATSGLIFGYDIKDTVNSYLGEPTQNLATDSLSLGGWPGSATLVDSATKTFDCVTSSIEWGGPASWTTFYYDVSQYTGQYVTISAVVESVDESNGTFNFIWIGQTINSETYLGYSPEADRNFKGTKTRERISWSGVIGSGGKVGILIWMNNGSGGATGSVRVRFSNVQVELKSHPTAFMGRSRNNLLSNTNVSSWGKQAGVTVDSTMLRGPLGNENVYRINFGSYSGGDAIGTSISGNIGTTYTFSGWVRGDSSTSGYITIGRANSNPSVQQAMSITTAWQYFEVSYTLNTNTTLYHNFAGINTSYYVADLAIKSNVRETDKALLDLSGTKKIYLTNASFDSNSEIVLDGTDDYISGGPSTEYLPIPYHSLEACIKSPGLGPGMNTCAIFGITYGLIVQIYASGEVGYYAYTTDGGSQVLLFSLDSSGINLLDNNWHHVVCTRDNTNVNIYVDGVLNRTTGNGGNWSGTNVWSSMTMLVGNNPNNIYYYFNGSIGVAKIYNRALTTGEVLQNFKTYRTKYSIS